MSEYNFVDNTELVELVERGLRKGYWDKALILELKKRFKELEKQEKLLKLYKEYFEYSEMLKDGRKFGGRMLVEHERDKIIEEIKEIENETRK